MQAPKAPEPDVEEEEPEEEFWEEEHDDRPDPPVAADNYQPVAYNGLERINYASSPLAPPPISPEAPNEQT